MKTKHFIYSFLFLNSFIIFGQAKKIKFKDKYIHTSTKFEFPSTLLEYKLFEVNSFDKKKENVCIDYKNENTKISIFIYPANSGTENRLRSEYLNSILAINYKNNQNKKFDFKHVKIEKENVIVNGLKTIFRENIENKNSLLSIYECGTWFLKIRITSDSNNDSLDLLEKSIIEKFNPTSLTLVKPLNLKGKVSVSKLAVRDSLFLASNLSLALNKLAWERENILEKERISGLTDLDIRMHIKALKAFISLESENNNSPTKKITLRGTPETSILLDKLKKIDDLGYLDEYIFDSYDEIMLVPDDVKFDIEEYKKWKTDNVVPEFIFLKATQVSYEEN